MATAWDWDKGAHFVSINADIEALRAALDDGLPVDLTEPSGWSLLHLAAIADWNEADDGRMRLLLERGAQREGRTKSRGGWTPLHWACYEGYAAQVRVLVEFGADVEARSDSATTPLMVVAEGSLALLDKARILLDAGAYANRTDNAGMTALDLASASVAIWRGIVADRGANASLRLSRERALGVLEEHVALERLIRRATEGGR